MQCYRCGKLIRSDSKYKSCPKCREEMRKRGVSKYHANHPNAKRYKQSSCQNKLSLDEKLKVVADYNRQNGTCLSYGKYIAKFGGF
jgi:uncharacterized CHY-type Zn-finger protein